MNKNKTSLFNLHEIHFEENSLLIEFYAGDIFDITSEILLLSAFKGGFNPSPGSTWESLFDRTGISFIEKPIENTVSISENIILLPTPVNKYFSKLITIELSDWNKRTSFTAATLITRYKELGRFLENYPSAHDESISLPLLGTGNQEISLEDSVSELLKTINNLKQTKLKIIRIFARNFESIGVLNKRINKQLYRNEVVQNNLRDAAIEEAKAIAELKLSAYSKSIITDLLSLSAADHSALSIFGLKGRLFAESICDEFIRLYNITTTITTLDFKIKEVTYHLKFERPYVISYLRLLQSYGNQVAHHGNQSLNYQDAAAIIIAIVRIVDFYEMKLNT
jgi:hypothetical protein